MAKATDPSGTVDFAALAAFRHALDGYLEASASLVREADLTPRQFSMLLALRAEDERGLTVTDLARSMFITHHAAVELSQRAETAGLIRRGPDDADGRVVRLTLTLEGRRRVEALAGRHAAQLGEARSELLSRIARWTARLEGRVADVGEP